MKKRFEPRLITVLLVVALLIVTTPSEAQESRVGAIATPAVAATGFISRGERLSPRETVNYVELQSSGRVWSGEGAGLDGKGTWMVAGLIVAAAGITAIAFLAPRKKHDDRDRYRYGYYYY
jgi:hypothetical protein